MNEDSRCVLTALSMDAAKASCMFAAFPLRLHKVRTKASSWKCNSARVSHLREATCLNGFPLDQLLQAKGQGLLTFYRPGTGELPARTPSP